MQLSNFFACQDFDSLVNCFHWVDVEVAFSDGLDDFIAQQPNLAHTFPTLDSLYKRKKNDKVRYIKRRNNVTYVKKAFYLLGCAANRLDFAALVDRACHG